MIFMDYIVSLKVETIYVVSLTRLSLSFAFAFIHDHHSRSVARAPPNRFAAVTAEPGSRGSR